MGTRTMATGLPLRGAGQHLLSFVVASLLLSVRPQVGLALAVVAGVGLVLGRHQRRVVAGSVALGFVALAALWVWVPLIVGSGDGSVEGRTLSLVSINVDGPGADHAEAIAFLERQRADVVFVQEMTPTFADAVERSGWDGVPVVARARDDTRGSAIYVAPDLLASVVGAEVFALPSDSDRPLTTARLRLGAEEVTLLNWHAIRPRFDNGGTRRIHAAAHRELGEWVAGRGGPVVVAGDFNATPWSPVVRSVGLRHAGDGHGLYSTWPDVWSPLGVPIDFALVSDDITVTGFGVGPSVGSDHRPVVMEWGRAP